VRRLIREELDRYAWKERNRYQHERDAYAIPDVRQEDSPRRRSTDALPHFTRDDRIDKKHQVQDVKKPAPRKELGLNQTSRNNGLSKSAYGDKMKSESEKHRKIRNVTSIHDDQRKSR